MLTLLAWVLAACGPLVLHAQTAPGPSLSTEASLSAMRAEPSGEAVSIVFFNRPVAVLRARVLGRGPAERAESARHVLDDLAERRITDPVSWRSFADGALISVADRAVLALTPPDVDEMAGERVDEVAAQTVERLRRALDEAAEARSPGVLLRSSAAAVLVIALGLLALWGITRARRAVGRKIVTLAGRTVARAGIADIDSIVASQLPVVERAVVTVLSVVLDLAVIYATLGFVLRRFPYTRPWGESMRGFLLVTAKNMGLGVANALPGLVTVVIIFFIARLVVRLIGFWFNAVERGRLTPQWIYPETAQPTRRLLTGLVWVFALVVAYPYLPGSETDAFKGVTVFLGLMVTVGSSGLVNHIMSGFMITYSRALRLGDFVRIGEVEGTVTLLGVLSTKVKTIQQEEVTIPNAVVVAQTIVDYSRLSDTEGVFTPTAVTIGYDAPWRQVQSLLMMAADRTTGLRRSPKPIVLQTSLEDFYVRYTLLVCLEQQHSRPFTLHALHANIQDLFNEHGVQIMSPNYVLDPVAPKLVAKQNWFAAPAERAQSATPDGGPVAVTGPLLPSTSHRI